MILSENQPIEKTIEIKGDSEFFENHKRQANNGSPVQDG